MALYVRSLGILYKAIPTIGSEKCDARTRRGLWSVAIGFARHLIVQPAPVDTCVWRPGGDGSTYGTSCRASEKHKPYWEFCPNCGKPIEISI